MDEKKQLFLTSMEIWDLWKIPSKCGEDFFFWSSIKILEKTLSNCGEDLYFLVFSRFVIGTENFIAAKGAICAESL